MNDNYIILFKISKNIDLQFNVLNALHDLKSKFIAYQTIQRCSNDHDC